MDRINVQDSLYRIPYDGRAGLCSQSIRPIAGLPDNPRYFEFRGKPAVLITSGEHYGAVINLDFNYTAYLDELVRHGFNLTRIFSGTYREVAGSFNITGNTPAPARGPTGGREQTRHRAEPVRQSLLRGAQQTLRTRRIDYGMELSNHRHPRGNRSRAAEEASHRSRFPTLVRGRDRSSPALSILNFHAAKPATVRLNYHLNKVIAFDETGGSDRSDRKYRT